MTTKAETADLTELVAATTKAILQTAGMTLAEFAPSDARDSSGRQSSSTSERPRVKKLA